MKNYYILECKNTRMGSLTTMGGEKYGFSKTKRCWKEKLPVEIGDEIVITDISNIRNNKKHYCYKVRIISVKPVKGIVIEQAGNPCQFCSEE